MRHRILKGPGEFFGKIWKGYEKFHTTICEGHYRAEPLTIWSLIRPPKKKDLPETPQTATGAMMIGTSRTLGKRFMWAAIFAALSIQTLYTVAIALAGVGVCLLTLEYNRSKRAGEEVIREVNFAGQIVEGKRKDLYHLHYAQERIMNLSASFKQASMESTTDTIDRIMKTVAEHRARIKVIEGGRFGAGTDTYEFSEPGIKLVADDNGAKISRAPGSAFSQMAASPPLASPAALGEASVKPAFEKATLSEDEIVERIQALHRALPPHLLERVMTPPKPPTPAVPPAA